MLKYEKYNLVECRLFWSVPLASDCGAVYYRLRFLTTILLDRVFVRVSHVLVAGARCC